MEVTPKNITTVLGKQRHPPVFLVVSSVWCSKCLEMKPDWDKLAAKYENDTNVVFATIDEDAYHHFGENHLKDFKKLPAIYWVKQTPDVAELYTGLNEYVEFEKWVNEKLAERIHPITNHSELVDYIWTWDNSSIFLFQGPISPELEILLDDTFFWIKDFPVKFLHLQYNEFNRANTSKPFLTHIFGPTGQFDDYEGDWTNKTLFPFMYRHKFPTITNASTLFIDRCSTDRQIKRFVVFQDYLDVYDEFKYIYNLTNLTVYFPDINFGTIECRNSYKLCQRFGLTYHSYAQLVVIEGHKHRWYTYKGEFLDEDVADFLERALRGDWPASGPGAGWKGIFYNFGVFLKQPKVALSIFGVLIGTFTILMNCCQRHRRHRRRRRPIMPTEANADGTPITNPDGTIIMAENPDSYDAYNENGRNSENDENNENDQNNGNDQNNENGNTDIISGKTKTD